jgi:hypothetical protein
MRLEQNREATPHNIRGKKIRLPRRVIPAFIMKKRISDMLYPSYLTVDTYQVWSQKTVRCEVKRTASLLLQL